MPHVIRAILTTALFATLLGCAGPAEPPTIVDPSTPSAPEGPSTPPESSRLEDLKIDFVLVADGFDQPLYVTGAGDGSGRLFVAEKTGALWTVRDGEIDDTPFLDLRGRVSTESELGLLGVAFTPDFAASGVVYVSYTDLSHASVLSRFDSDGVTADPNSERVLLRVEQPYANHNGGGIAFGPDGMLYLGLGDGGSAGDPLRAGQDLSTPLGKMLRIDVGATGAWSTQAGVPADNPFVDVAGADPLIWSYGLRNPWRFSFDRETGDLWIGDVGQNALEEVNFQPAASQGGENWGWSLFEGTDPFPPDRDVTENRDAFAWPLVEYRHPTGKSVTGGYVYRGDAFPLMRGVYLYGDFVTGRVWGVARGPDGPETRELATTEMAISSFGEDDEGELYVVDFQGGLYRVEAR
ncbi:MAG: PQQ-dependent sugar dehydrogenase [Clostridiales bacterium]|nr:PQQ-dependent sugar dehydrogenase [Clostridiales bacterium]